MVEIVRTWEVWIRLGGILIGAVLLGYGVYGIVFAVGKRLARRTGNTLDDALVRYARRPGKVIAPLLGIYLALPALGIRAELAVMVRHVLTLGLLAVTGWLLLRIIAAVDEVVSAKYSIDVTDNLAARRIRTQAQMLRRVAATVVVVLTGLLMLMTFPGARQIGLSLFASAGIAGLVIGMAARPALSNLIAGLQIALTEPIRIDDVVIVEGEWGWIEEISPTYVVVRIWDLRRLVVPLSYFIERPFQNWTRKTADILGTVFVYTDYTVPVEAVRQELHRILSGSTLWDGKVWGLQVTNTSEHTMELRALMSAQDSGKAWDLRCLVREKLIAFLQEQYPAALPRTRVALQQQASHSSVTPA